MILYLIKSTLCLAFMLGLYLLLLEKEKMHRFNRFYLIFVLVFSFLVPLAITESHLQMSLLAGRLTEDNLSNKPNTIITDGSFDWVVGSLYIIYIAITLGLVFRLLKNVFRIVSTGVKNECILFRSAKLVLVESNAVSFTFWNYIFVDIEEYFNKNIEKEVLVHELAHAKQKHTADILFIELLQAVFWFNPILKYYKKAIQLNHEFLADEAVVREYNAPKSYQALLLSKIADNSHIKLSSSFNYLITRKRLIMLTSGSSSRNIMIFKKMSIFPLAVLAVALFSSTRLTSDHLPIKGKEKNRQGFAKSNAEKNINVDVPVGLENSAKSPPLNIEVSASPGVDSSD
jgi:beta-lactamase regulating signal transducer with metallopeptidase domain